MGGSSEQKQEDAWEARAADEVIVLDRPRPQEKQEDAPAVRTAVDRQHERHAARMRRHRQRQATGRLSVTTDFTPEETAKLCQLRYLTECELEDRDRIAQAIHALLANIVTDEP